MANTAEPDRMIGESPAFLQALEAVSKVAPLEKPVLVVGERGTGKELIASRLHFLSNRWDREFLKLNCAAISDTLIESELFGHEAGSFTGASRTHQGRFERAERRHAVPRRAREHIGVSSRRSCCASSNTESSNASAATRRCGPTSASSPPRTRICRDSPPRAGSAWISSTGWHSTSSPCLPLRERPEDILLLAEYFAINMASELGRDFFPGFHGGRPRAKLSMPTDGRATCAN